MTLKCRSMSLSTNVTEHLNEVNTCVKREICIPLLRDTNIGCMKGILAKQLLCSETCYEKPPHEYTESCLRDNS